MRYYDRASARLTARRLAAWLAARDAESDAFTLVDLDPIQVLVQQIVIRLLLAIGRWVRARCVAARSRQRPAGR